MLFSQGLSWIFSLKHLSNKLTLQPKKEENDDTHNHTGNNVCHLVLLSCL